MPLPHGGKFPIRAILSSSCTCGKSMRKIFAKVGKTLFGKNSSGDTDQGPIINQTASINDDPNEGFISDDSDDYVDADDEESEHAGVKDAESEHAESERRAAEYFFQGELLHTELPNFLCIDLPSLTEKWANGEAYRADLPPTMASKCISDFKAFLKDRQDCEMSFVMRQFNEPNSSMKAATLIQLKAHTTLR